MTAALAPPPADPAAASPGGAAAAEGRPVLFFDGVCGLCNVAVDWLIARDPAGKLRFAPLQGETAAALLPETDTERPKYLVLLDESGRRIRTAAVIGALRHLGGKWSAAAWALWVVPAPLRDLAYHGVTKVRYLVWGKKETCRLPTPEERSRFLP